MTTPPESARGRRRRAALRRLARLKHQLATHRRGGFRVQHHADGSTSYRIHPAAMTADDLARAILQLARELERLLAPQERGGPPVLPDGLRTDETRREEAA